MRVRELQHSQSASQSASSHFSAITGCCLEMRGQSSHIPKLRRPPTRWCSSSLPSPHCTRSPRIGSRPGNLTWLWKRRRHVQRRVQSGTPDTISHQFIRHQKKRNCRKVAVGDATAPELAFAAATSALVACNFCFNGPHIFVVRASSYSFVHRVGTSKHFLEGLSARATKLPSRWNAKLERHRRYRERTQTLRKASTRCHFSGDSLLTFSFGLLKLALFGYEPTLASKGAQWRACSVRPTPICRGSLWSCWCWCLYVPWEK